MDPITETNGTTDTNQNQEAAKTYTQDEFDKHMAGLRKAMEASFKKQLSDLGDLEELKNIRQQAEQMKTQEAIKRGEIETLLKDLAAKKDAEIAQKNRIIEEYTVNTPLLNAAAQYRAVNPQQVVKLLREQVRLGESGAAEVIDDRGMVRYDASGNQLKPEDFVKEWLDQNPHFVSAAPATTQTKSSSPSAIDTDFDLAKLDLSRPDHREIYRKARNKGLI